MNQALLSGIASKAYDKLLKAAESKQPIAVTGRRISRQNSAPIRAGKSC